MSQIVKTTAKRSKPSIATHTPTDNATVGIKKHAPQLGNCLQENVVYRATIRTNNSIKQYGDETEDTVKQRIYNHKLSFTNRNYSTNTSLSIYIWRLKDMNISRTITWEILKLVPAYSNTSRMPSLPPRETSNYHSSITNHPVKQKISNSIQMKTWEQTSTLTFRPIHITHPPNLYYLHY